MEGNQLNGNYNATATEGVVWEAQSGAIMVSFLFTLENGATIKGAQCLIQKDGSVSEITVKTLKACFGWDGVDPFWLEDPANLADRPVELVIEPRTFTNDQGEAVTVPSVKYINAPGGGLPESMDRNAFQTRFGSKFRALAGGTTPKRAAKPATKPAAKAPTKAPGKAPSKTATATMDEVWAAYNKACADSTSEDDRSNTWFIELEKIHPDTDPATLTPQQWGAILPNVSAWADNVPF